MTGATYGDGQISPPITHTCMRDHKAVTSNTGPITGAFYQYTAADKWPTHDELTALRDDKHIGRRYCQTFPKLTYCQRARHNGADGIGCVLFKAHLHGLKSAQLNRFFFCAVCDTCESI